MSSGLSCDGYKREIYYYVALVLHSLPSTFRCRLRRKRRRRIRDRAAKKRGRETKRDGLRARDEENKHEMYEWRAEWENRLLFCLYGVGDAVVVVILAFIPCYFRSAGKCACVCGFLCECVSKVVWLSNWHTWISGTPKNVQRNEKRFVTFSGRNREKIVFLPAAVALPLERIGEKAN